MTTTSQLMTAEELMQLDGPYRYELIKGELLTMSLPGAPHGAITVKLAVLLHTHVVANQLGTVFAETGFKLGSNPDTVLGPDISFVANVHVSSLTEGFYPGPPDLAVEVRSPSDRRTTVERKTALWLSCGTKSVWLVDPRQRTVEVVHASGERKLLHQSDELVDDTVPGFHVPISEIFN
jgi:Uma2 family endonuclease